MDTSTHPPRPPWLDPLFGDRTVAEVSRAMGVSQPSAHAWSTGASLPDRLSEAGLRRLVETVGDGPLDTLRAEGWPLRDLAAAGAVTILLARARLERSTGKKNGRGEKS